MSGREHLSTLFEYQLELISKSVNIKHEDLLGQPATVRLELPDYQTRYFNGIVSRFSHTGFDGSLAIYQATLVPWFWLLSRTTDCRIFQDQTVPEIVKEIFREHGYIDFQEFLINELYLPRRYCVQYRETDFAFISRLLEQEGIHYFFRHEADKHTLVLADDNGAHRSIAGYEEIPYYPPDETALRERDHISGWSVAGAVQSGAFVHTDFDFTAPRKDLLTERDHPHEHARADLERYDYSGGYTQYDQGDDWVRARIEELHVDYETVKGAGNARGLATGARFKLTKYPRQDQNREYLLLSA
ncbi:type VI secretion system Vgr family protein, partial [Candidatus Thiosymbion oneisti]|uniref:type VI secretion system Vgr family protein n=1 Tax=Candidatus Thiosymbion oneisti TaxID=589554 RepID=UPI0013FDA4CB